MTKRERFFAAMAHQQPDHTPVDFCGMSLTSAGSPTVVERVAKALGITEEGNRILPAVQQKLGADFTSVGYIFNPDNIYNKTSPTKTVDCWGVERTDTGLYWDITYSPLADAEIEDLETFHWPDAADIPQSAFDQLAEQAKRLYYDSDLVVIGEHPTYGVMELGCWMCGFDDFLYRMLAEPEFVERFFDHVWQYQRNVIDRYYSAIGPYLHITTSGDDFGTQNAPFLSPETFRQLIAPRYKERIALTKQHTKAYYFHHTCGSVYRLMDQIADCGVDILNPIQPGALEMEPERIKRDFGHRFTFWGGIDEQKLLTSGTAQEVYRETQHVLSILGKDGGYVMAPSHNIQVDVPTENILAMYQAAKDMEGWS